MGINAAGEKLFLRFSQANIFLESYHTRPAIFRKYSISQLTCSDWVSSKTQIVRAFRMKFCKMALPETPSGRLFGVFDQYQWKIRLHLHTLPMGMGQTKFLSHWQAKKKNPSLMPFLPIENRNNFFSRSGRKKNKKPSRMTFLAAVKSETSIFLRLAWYKIFIAIYIKFY